IQSYVLERLADPELDARSIAAAHHISLSYLYRLFEDVGTPVAAWIRRRRLDRARRDLADPALAHVPIHRIGARWGFVHATDFSRAFRSAYGLTPSAFRRQHSAPRPSTPT
ncbi:MAG TPA: helix-turn-helix domain-containing protein, partial [Actinopolymorphaceae bacterium]